jgi:hypothetical protein
LIRHIPDLAVGIDGNVLALTLSLTLTQVAAAPCDEFDSLSQLQPTGALAVLGMFLVSVP